MGFSDASCTAGKLQKHRKLPDTATTTTSTTSTTTATTTPCREFIFTAERPGRNTGAILTTVEGSTLSSCRMSCELFPACKSLSRHAGTKQCRLFAETGILETSDQAWVSFGKACKTTTTTMTTTTSTATSTTTATSTSKGVMEHLDEILRGQHVLLRRIKELEAKEAANAKKISVLSNEVPQVFSRRCGGDNAPTFNSFDRYIRAQLKSTVAFNIADEAACGEKCLGVDNCFGFAYEPEDKKCALAER